MDGLSRLFQKYLMPVRSEPAKTPSKLTLSLFETMLPIEVRLKIYEYVLYFGCPLRRTCITRSGGACLVSILLMNRLVHKEAIATFYQQNRFRFQLNELCAYWNRGTIRCLTMHPYGSLEIICDKPRGSLLRETARLQALIHHLRAGGYPKLRTIVCRLDPNTPTQKALSDMLSGSGKNVRYIGVGTLEVIPRKAHEPQVTYEHRAIASMWQYLAALHPDDEILTRRSDIPKALEHVACGHHRLILEVKRYLTTYYTGRSQRRKQARKPNARVSWAQEVHSEDCLRRVTEFCTMFS